MMLGIEKLRYLKCLYGLTENWPAKLTVSTLSTVVIAFWDKASELFETHPILLMAVIGVTVLDILTGIIRSYKKKDPIVSLGLRQFFVKVIEYTATILTATMLANAFGSAELSDWVGYLLVVFKNVDYLAYFYVFYTEALSVYENLGEKKSSVSGFWEKFKSKVDEKLNA